MTSTSAAHAWRPVVLAGHGRHVKRKDLRRDALTERSAIRNQLDRPALSQAQEHQIEPESVCLGAQRDFPFLKKGLEESRFAVKPKFCDAPRLDQTKALEITVFTN